ncbi:MAG: nucleotidyltransferase domain-containing protein [Anaerolineae bacterium]|nr:nucleotidyltransferase domain-containing protein [Anaerolineae bacterium]MCX8068466.1 nucleotidyltransferase domain-containing protein [Anaerolineae bacterium]MDW7992709.1 nucleotidyltransferase domain-containing protein [Anaerolineae bacterium]
MQDIPREINPEQVIQALREGAEAFFGPFPVDAAYVYGSVVTGPVHPFSDVDVALLLDEEALRDLSPYERLRLEADVELRIADLTGIHYADGRTINDAPIAWRGEVVLRGICIYSRNERHRIIFETRTWKEYFDFRPVLERMCRELIARWREELKVYG